MKWRLISLVEVDNATFSYFRSTSKNLSPNLHPRIPTQLYGEQAPEEEEEEKKEEEAKAEEVAAAAAATAAAATAAATTAAPPAARNGSACRP